VSCRARNGGGPGAWVQCVLDRETCLLTGRIQGADQQYRRLFKIICDIEDVASYTPAAIGESAERTAIVSAPDDNKASYCKALTGKALFSVLYGTCTVTLAI
jgi:hypothetical protein